MDEELFQALLQNFAERGREDMGEGDYEDLLWKYSHMLNQGGGDDDMSVLLATVPEDRRQAMMEHGGGPALDSNLFRRANRAGLNRLLKRGL